MNVLIFRCFIISFLSLVLAVSISQGTKVINSNQGEPGVYQQTLQNLLLRILRQRQLSKQQQTNTFDESLLDADDVINEFFVPDDDAEDNEELKTRVDDIFLEPLKTNVSTTTKALLSLVEHTSVTIKKAGKAATSEWGEYSCCRRPLNIQTRERMANSRYLQLQSRECSWNYCTTCLDDIESSCAILKNTQDACNPKSHYKGFMSRHCPFTCKWCDSEATTTTESSVIVRTTPTRRPTRVTKPAKDENMETISIYTNGDPSLRLYMFRPQSESEPSSPWRSNTEELTTFDVYKTPSGMYKRPVYFCKANHKSSQKWTIRKRGCSNGWNLDFKVYVSDQNVNGSGKMYIANFGRGPWTSRISTSPPCCGYTSAVWPIYVPTGPLITNESNEPYIPSATKRPTVRPTLPTKKPTGGKPSLSPFEKECLEYHNFFRAIHNVPALKWDNSLAETTRKWANYLVDRAPSHPFKIKSGTKRTRHWPHSDKGTTFRGNGVGENIAWDFSVAGSPAKESVLRWYAEIAYYNPQDPFSTPSNKPIGHYTQLLWKESTSLGCARVYKSIERLGRTYKTSYTVAHYAPGGNIRYSRRNSTLRAYRENVPLPKSGTCMSTSCGTKLPYNKCMGFNNDVRCSCSNSEAGVYGSRPVCQGNGGGCMVNCDKPKNPPIPGYFIWENSCQGKNKCECIYSPVNSRAGATCS